MPPTQEVGGQEMIDVRRDAEHHTRGRVCSPELLRGALKSSQSGSSRIRLPPDNQLSAINVLPAMNLFQR